jgi:hypothetical protein
LLPKRSQTGCQKPEWLEKVRFGYLKCQKSDWMQKVRLGVKRLGKKVRLVKVRMVGKSQIYLALSYICVVVADLVILTNLYLVIIVLGNVV